MIISADELAAIEAWRFANRVQSKSEAVRRLCQIGLIFNAENRTAKELTRTALVASTSGIRALLQEAKRSDDEQNERLRGIAAIILGAVDAQLALYQDMVATDATARTMAGDGDFDDLMREAARIVGELREAPDT